MTLAQRPVSNILITMKSIAITLGIQIGSGFPNSALKPRAIPTVYLGPKSHQAIRPTNGKTRINSVQSIFEPVLALLPNTLKIAMMSKISMIRPIIPYSIFLPLNLLNDSCSDNPTPITAEEETKNYYWHA